MSSPTFLLLSDGRCLNLAAVAYVVPVGDAVGERLAVWMARDIPVPDLEGADAELLRQAVHAQRWTGAGPACRAEENAVALVLDLFTNRACQQASRLVLMDDALGRDLGDWCREAVLDLVRKHMGIEPSAAPPGEPGPAAGELLAAAKVAKELLSALASQLVSNPDFGGHFCGPHADGWRVIEALQAAIARYER